MNCDSGTDLFLSVVIDLGRMHICGTDSGLVVPNFFQIMDPSTYHEPLEHIMDP